MSEISHGDAVSDAKQNDELFDVGNQINDDQDFWFKLRGGAINPLIDAATPLLAMGVRIRNLQQCDNVDEIYKQVVEEVKSIEVEVSENGFEHAMVLAYRYVLCAFLDEAVMSTPWGADTIWAEHSLLTRFHNEAWGGEKVFSILSRLEGEPVRYRILLEFIYLCLCLGFKGRYRVVENGKELYERVIFNLNQTLVSLGEPPPSVLTSTTERVVVRKYKIGKQIPIWTVFAGFLSVSTLVFIVYALLLNAKSSSVLEQLKQILN